MAIETQQASNINEQIDKNNQQFRTRAADIINNDIAPNQHGVVINAAIKTYQESYPDESLSQDNLNPKNWPLFSDILLIIRDKRNILQQLPDDIKAHLGGEANFLRLVPYYDKLIKIANQLKTLKIYRQLQHIDPLNLQDLDSENVGKAIADYEKIVVKKENEVLNQPSPGSVKPLESQPPQLPKKHPFKRPDPIEPTPPFFPIPNEPEDKSKVNSNESEIPIPTSPPSLSPNTVRPTEENNQPENQPGERLLPPTNVTTPSGNTPNNTGGEGTSPAPQATGEQTSSESPATSEQTYPLVDNASGQPGTAISDEILNQLAEQNPGLAEFLNEPGVRAFVKTLDSSRLNNLAQVVHALAIYARSAPSAPHHNLIEALKAHPRAMGAILEFGPEGIELLARRGTELREYLERWTVRLAEVAPGEGYEILVGVRRTMGIRGAAGQFPGTTNPRIGRRSNVAFTDIDIVLPNGERLTIQGENFIGVSGEDSPEGTIEYPGPPILNAPLPGQENTRFFSTGVPRDNAADAEVKIFEEFIKILRQHNIQPSDYQNVSGNVKLFTERKPCPACGPNLIENQFRPAFPNIRLTVIHGPDKPDRPFPPNQPPN